MDRNARVLIVDDDENIRNTLKMILEDEGYIVDLAATGSEAIQKDSESILQHSIIRHPTTRHGRCRIIETIEKHYSTNTKNNGYRIPFNAKRYHSIKQQRRRIPNQACKRREALKHIERADTIARRRKTIQ